MVFEFIVAGLLGGARAHAAPAWTAQTPAVADRPEDWNALLPQLMERGMYYGALSGARDMLNFFSDLPTKELGYRTIINLVDLGYPFSVRPLFVSGDLELAASPGDNFAESYLLYKGLVNLDKKMDKWADYYLSKLDREKSPKYLFYRGLDAYAKKQLPEAVTWLKKALAVTSGPEMVNLAKKEARTLARIYYETGDYQKSLEIYQTFLLKTAPVSPVDWLETAWNFYQLKRFPDALGVLYNFESQHTGPTLPLEKYVLRGLIYREYCATTATENLVKSFNREFGKVITGIKTGEPLASFPALLRIEDPAAQDYRQFTQTLTELERESRQIKTLPRKLRGLATYVYQSETAALRRGRQYLEDRALEALARHLVILGESLRFLRFDVAREKFSPDRVFAEAPPEPDLLVDSLDEQNFRLHWRQWGDFWRDERLVYRGLVKSKCER